MALLASAVVGAVLDALGGPLGVAVFAHVDGAGEFVAFEFAREGVGEHGAFVAVAGVEDDLGAIDVAAEFAGGDVAAVGAGEFGFGLFEDEVVGGRASGVVDGEGPLAVDVGVGAGGLGGAVDFGGLGEERLETLGDEFVFAGHHHVGLDADGAGFGGAHVAGSGAEDDAGGVVVGVFFEFTT